MIPLESTRQLVILQPESSLGDLGTLLARSGYFKGSPNQEKAVAQAIVKVLAGRELGISPVAAMSGIHIIEDKPSISAGLMAGLIKKSERYNYQILEATDVSCLLNFLELDAVGAWAVIGQAGFTIDEAKKADLMGPRKLNWKRYPADMLFARALSRGARRHCPDLFTGTVYTHDEMNLKVGSDGEAVLDDTGRPVADQPPAISVEVTRSSVPPAAPRTGVTPSETVIDEMAQAVAVPASNIPPVGKPPAATVSSIVLADTKHEGKTSDPCSPVQGSRIEELFVHAGIAPANVSSILAKRGVDCIDGLNAAQADELIVKLETHLLDNHIAQSLEGTEK